MLVDKNKCVGCGNCVPVCTMGVIYIQDGKANINEDECVECGTCERFLTKENRNPTLVRAVRRILKAFRLAYDPPVDVCPTGALVRPKLEWPRNLRREFSDPTEPHPSTGGTGRGTEEIKTNDVTGRLKEGEVGLIVEMGRPGIGARFRDLEKVAMALAELGATFEKHNPVTALMVDPITGKLRDDVLNEKVLSAIIESKTTLDKLPAMLQRLKELESEVDTVFAVAVGSRCRPDGTVPHEEVVRTAGWHLSPNGKTNLGLGRPRYEDRVAASYMEVKA